MNWYKDDGGMWKQILETLGEGKTILFLRVDETRKLQIIDFHRV